MSKKAIFALVLLACQTKASDSQTPCADFNRAAVEIRARNAKNNYKRSKTVRSALARMGIAEKDFEKDSYLAVKQMLQREAPLKFPDSSDYVTDHKAIGDFDLSTSQTLEKLSEGRSPAVEGSLDDLLAMKRLEALINEVSGSLYKNVEKQFASSCNDTSR